MSNQGPPISKCLPKARSGRRSLADDATSVAEGTVATVATKQPSQFKIFSEFCDWVFTDDAPWSKTDRIGKHKQVSATSPVVQENRADEFPVDNKQTDARD